MGIENKSVAARNWQSGERLTIKRHEGVWRNAGTVLYLDCNDFTQLYTFVKMQRNVYTHRDEFYCMLIIPLTHKN